ncbi:MAG TPA: hypothetical protein VH062_30925 [Polyangiaceae bacterium]|jgi:Mrp family chromosome partitioning ATPase|nr:hypothetical protein [Polyangiaceae bacterium]
MAAGIARYWRSSLAVFVCVAAVGVAIAYGIPAVYESTATLDVTRVAPPAGAKLAPMADEANALLADHVRLEKILHDPSLAGFDRTLPIATLSDVAHATAKSDRTLSVAYRAGAPESARDLCGALADVFVAYFGKDSKGAAHAELEHSTKALADFVNAHPNLLLESAAPGASAAHPTSKPSAAADLALNVLKGEKARLEAELAQAPAADPSKENPYDEGTPSAADLQRQLAQVKYAISARQKAAAAASPSASAAPAAPDQLALQTEWHKLVRAVVDAEHPPASADAVSAAKLVQPPTLPDGPVSPNRLLLLGVAIAAALWLALLTAVVRSVRGGRELAVAAGIGRPVIERIAAPVLDGNPPPQRLVGRPTPPLAFGGANPPPTQAPTTPRVSPSDAPPVAAGQSGTRLGMMDPALVRTQIDGTPMDLQALLEGPRQSGTPTAIGTPAMQVAEPAPVERAALRSDEPPKTIKGTSPAAEAFGATRPSSGAPPAPRPSSDAPPVAPRPSSDAPPGRKPMSSNPPRLPLPKTEPPRGPGPASVRPSRIPTATPMTAAAKASDVFSPPPNIRNAPHTEFVPSPDTQRIGSPYGPGGDFPKTISPPPPPPSVPPRVDLSGTKYSYVDRNRTSRPPRVVETGPASSRSAPSDHATRPSQAPRRSPSLVEVQDLVNQPQVAERRASIRPPAPVMDVPYTNLRVPDSTPPVRAAEVWQKVSAPASNGDENVLVRRSVSASWRLQPELLGGNGALAGLRDKVFDSAAHGPFVIAVTSEQDALDEKTVIASRLSAMLSDEGRARVLLMEANFDYPSVHRVMGVEMPSGTGFSQQLRMRLRSGERKPWTVLRCTDTLDVLAEGLVRSPGALLSQEFANAVADLRGCYDVIVIDSPVAGRGVETKPIGSVSDGIAIVAKPTTAQATVLERGMQWFGHKKLLVAVPSKDT